MTLYICPNCDNVLNLIYYVYPKSIGRVKECEQCGYFMIATYKREKFERMKKEYDTEEQNKLYGYDNIREFKPMGRG